MTLSVPAGMPQARGLRVLFVIPGEPRGSSMIFAMRQARALEALGVRVHAFHLRSRTSPLLLVREFRRYRRELDAFDPHIVHAHFGTVTALFAALGSRAVPLVITFRGSDLNPAPGSFSQRLRGWLARGLSQLASLAADAIVCVSAQLRQRLRWAAARAVVLPSGVDPDVFYPRPRDRARRRLGWGQEPVVLFNAGHGARVKRQDLAEAAVAAARRRLPQVRLEVLDGDRPPDTIPVLMNAADCLLLTSDSEGSPTVVQEALASNLPVVSVDVGDVAERLNRVRASRITARDPDALAAALVEVLGWGGRSDGRRKLEEFSSARVAAELLRIYCSLAHACSLANTCGVAGAAPAAAAPPAGSSLPGRGTSETRPHKTQPRRRWPPGPAKPDRKAKGPWNITRFSRLRP